MKASAVDIGLSSPKTPRSTSKRSSMIQSGPTTPKTPRSLSKRALVFTREDSPLKMTFVAIDKEDSKQKSSRSSSAQATPKTPKGTPNRTTKNKPQKLSLEEEEEKDTSFESPIRKTTRIRTPKRFYDDPDAPKTPEDKKDMDFKIETKTAKIKTPKSTAKKNNDGEVQLPSTPKMKGTPKMGTPKVATPKMGTPTRSSRSSRNCTPKVATPKMGT